MLLFLWFIKADAEAVRPGSNIWSVCLGTALSAHITARKLAEAVIRRSWAAARPPCGVCLSLGTQSLTQQLKIC